MKKSIGNIIIALLLVASLALSFGGGYVLGGGTSPAPSEGLDVIEQVWNIIFHDYVDKDRLSASALSQAAIEGMVEVIDDPYISYLSAENYQLSSTSLEGEFGGIGAHVTVEDGQITIIAPIADSPAEKAGIRAGDIIVAVDGQPASEMSLAEAVLEIRGPEGTTVRLLVLHQGDTEPEEIEIIRAKIELPSVRFEMKEDIAYINITYFSKRTNEELPPVLESVIQQMATGIILDLRSNPGGSLETVIDIASHFLREGVVVNLVDNEEKQTGLEVEPDGATIDLPMVVLVDNYSASGSEVLAGALQDYGRATIAGTKTHGKGSVNILRQLKDGSGLYVTTARWLTPNGRLIEGEGLYPDYELELIGEEAIQWAIDLLKQ
jgi:carboxyl-terminal processing protease